MEKQIIQEGKLMGNKHNEQDVLYPNKGLTFRNRQTVEKLPMEALTNTGMYKNQNINKNNLTKNLKIATCNKGINGKKMNSYSDLKWQSKTFSQ